MKQVITLPFEIGETYKTRFATGEKFKVTGISYRNGAVSGFTGVYEKCPGVGECPIGHDRLVPKTVEIAEEPASGGKSCRRAEELLESLVADYSVTMPESERVFDRGRIASYVYNLFRGNYRFSFSDFKQLVQLMTERG